MKTKQAPRKRQTKKEAAYRSRRSPRLVESLRVSEQTAITYIQRQLHEGASLRDRDFTPNTFGSNQADVLSWAEENKKALSRIFGGIRAARDATSHDWIDPVKGPRNTVPKEFLDKAIQQMRKAVNSDYNALKKLLKSLGANELTQATRKHVFIVHGHDHKPIQAIKRIVRELGLKPIILHEQPDEGRTIIEKFEKHANVGYAVVLLTPDDVGGRNGAEEQQPRARQNVIFELGFFVGALKRQRICVLYKTGVEVPSDYGGILFVRLDTRGKWRSQLIRELKAATSSNKASQHRSSK